MEYKGYHASVVFDDDDEIFVGEVLGISDSLNFHGTSVDELRAMFRQSIDNYLDLCVKVGKLPERPRIAPAAESLHSVQGAVAVM